MVKLSKQRYNSRMRDRAEYNRNLRKSRPERYRIAVRRHRARSLGLPVPEMPPLERPVYKGICTTCGVEVIRKKSDGRTDRCNKCCKREHRQIEYAKRREARMDRGPLIYHGVCSDCGASVARRKNDGRTDRCDDCRTKYYYRAHKERRRPREILRLREYHKRTYEKKKLAGELWPQRNVERRRHHANIWHKRNRAASVELSARYRASKMQRIPPWADIEAVKCFYEIARRVTKCTGIRFEVDHVIPLRGRTVSGLHVATNLRVIPKSMNCRKSNKIAA